MTQRPEVLLRVVTSRKCFSKGMASSLEGVSWRQSFSFSQGLQCSGEGDEEVSHPPGFGDQYETELWGKELSCVPSRFETSPPHNDID